MLACNMQCHVRLYPAAHGTGIADEPYKRILCDTTRVSDGLPALESALLGE
jgi:hypothetical protein